MTYAIARYLFHQGRIKPIFSHHIADGGVGGGGGRGAGGSLLIMWATRKDKRALSTTINLEDFSRVMEKSVNQKRETRLGESRSWTIS